jgi:transcriptional regulator with XRE-family HTH domain
MTPTPASMEKSPESVFPQRLKSAREGLRKLTQEKLAERAGMPTSAISHFERAEGGRKPSFENLRRLAKALDVSIDYLVGRTDDPVAQVVDDVLYRHVKLLSDADRKVAELMVKELAERNVKK